jgi:hypothetical protein
MTTSSLDRHCSEAEESVDCSAGADTVIKQEARRHCDRQGRRTQPKAKNRHFVDDCGPTIFPEDTVV